MKKSGAKLSIAFLYDDTLDNNNGVAQYVKRLGAWLSNEGHVVNYLAGESQIKNWHGGPVYSLARNLKVGWGGNRLSISLIPNAGLINKVIAENTFDVIHVQVPYSPFMAQRVINRVPDSTGVVGTVHVFPANKLAIAGSKLLRLIYGKSLKRFDFVASVSQAAHEYASESFAIHSRILPNVIRLAEFNAKSPPKKNRRKIVFLGRLVKRKGVNYLILAFAKLANTYPDLDLVIAGDGPDKAKLEKLVALLDLNNRVSFTGWVTEEKKPDILVEADIACFPSLYGESFGIVLIEAMAAGAKVVIGGDNPGYRTVLGDNPETLINPRDVDAFAERLGKILDNPELATRIHRSQQKDVQKYDVNKVGKDWLKHYRQVIAKRSQKRHN